MNVLLVISVDDLAERERVWGRENLRQPARDREALTWLTLIRLLGWRETIAQGSVGATLEEGQPPDCVIVARDPDSVGEDDCAAIARTLERAPALVIARAASDGSPLAGLAGASRSATAPAEGRLTWDGPGKPRAWESRPSLELDSLDPPGARRRHRRRSLLGRARRRDEPTRWSSIGERPLAIARQVGRGTVLTLAAHPAELAGAAPSGTGLLAHLLRWGIPPPAAWLDLEGTVVLRMDDPGGAAAAHLDGWAHPLPSERDWSRLADQLERRRARLSIGYVSGWLDDGDPGRGALEVDGRPAERIAGAVHPSSRIVYRSRSGLVHDHPAELRGLAELRARGVGELEVHGYTHVRPDPDASASYSRWANTADRHESVSWYRELEGFERAGDGPDPVARGATAIEALIGQRPTTLACPGHACSPDAVECAIDAGLELVAAETLAIRSGERMLWSEHVRSPYVDGATGPWLEAGVPAIAGLHDRDIVGDPDWLADRLDEWLAAGCRRFWDLRQLAAALDHQVRFAEAPGDDGGGVQVERIGSGPAPVVQVPVLVRWADGRAEPVVPRTVQAQ